MCTMTSQDYFSTIVKNLAESLSITRSRLTTKETSPIKSDYKTELDTYEELSSEKFTMYQHLVGEVR